MSTLPAATEPALYPPLQPYRQGTLAVGDGHELYFEESGNPHGIAVVCLHGGPGSGGGALLRRFFDPQRCRIVVYDQRGAGRSRPAGALHGNRSEQLVGDLEALRLHLALPRWWLFGGSWGATLAVRYAQYHLERVQGLILRGPLLGRQRDLDWFFGPQGVARIYPRDYQAFLAPLAPEERATPLAGYARLLADPQRRAEAARHWAGWDHRVATGSRRTANEPAEAGRCAIACHYALNRFFLPPEGVLGAVAQLAGVPGYIVQGQLDLVCPAEGAATLAEEWAGAELELLEGAGHLMTDPAIARALVRATAELLGQP